MKLIMRTDDYTIYQRRDSRYAVQDANKAPINGDEKVTILLKHELVKAPEVKQPDPEPEAEAVEATEEAQAEAEAEAPAEEAPAEEAPAEEAPAEEAPAEEEAPADDEAT